MSTKSKKVAVVLSGCGHLDGAEVHESVLTLLALSREGAQYEGLAPNRLQHHVINHRTQEEVKGDNRNILDESARIMRGNIKPLDAANLDDYDAVIFPGGFGAAKNLFDFALKGDESFKVNEDVLTFAKKAYQMGKPMGFICISPMMMVDICGANVNMTIGNDLDVAKAIEAKGAKHHLTNVDGICIDKDRKVVSTPAYMLGENPYQVSLGIDKLVKAVLELSN
ncbi:isoprenoid biosynthesis glyoxalase ElbB [Thiotrichales bacterium 19S3-7]|nr:isoprenoid biosynthesis glyoxalase ElbB [Thiotrichales bacterium 19S3-7]MCF6801293.1 isoprenoid biosynthesis glyoxalase ElbB [Thiotrichales bacterium 19S3-11]